MKDPVGTGLLVTAIAAIVGGVSSWLIAVQNRPKIEADAQGVHIATEKVAITNAKDVIDIVNRAVAKEHEECQRSIASLRGRINRLERTLNEHNIPIPIGDT